MVGALIRWVKAIMYLMTGRIDAARATLDSDPHVIRAKYDEIVQTKKQRLSDYKNAVGAIVAQQERKKARLHALTNEIGEFEKLKAGALAMARQRVEELQRSNASPDEIKQDAKYIQYQARYSDFSSTLNEKENQALEVENDIKQFSQQVASHELALKRLQSEIQQIKNESADTVADVISAREEKELNDMIAGISTDTTNKELESLRDLRNKAKADVAVSQRLSGADIELEKAQFLEAAAAQVSSSEFDKLVGLEAPEKQVTSAPQVEKLPE